MMRKKMVLMTGGVETLDYFARQLEKTFASIGYQTFFFDVSNEEKSTASLAQFAGISDTILLTFNFEGLKGEDSLLDMHQNSFWDVFDVCCVNIMVDHPFFAPDLLEQLPKNYYAVSIDRFHESYLKTYYPEIKHHFFLPLGGTCILEETEEIPFEKRSIDVLFTGNFTPKETFDKYIYRLGDEYAAFYHGIIRDIQKNPDLPDDLVMLKHLNREFPHASHTEIRKTVGSLLFIDLYIRNHYRQKVVETLIQSGIRLHCVGNGWELLSAEKYPNFTYEPNGTSLLCLERMADAKISLNIMPWFKDGAHDRVFNAMANKSLCITDHSKYLDETLTDRENVLFYDIKKPDTLPSLIKDTLRVTEKCKEIAQNGFDITKSHHTWSRRALTLHEQLLRFL